LDSVSIQANATNDEVHLLQSTRFLRGTAPLVSTINEGQIANALTDVVYYPGSRHGTSFSESNPERELPEL
jgi:hypothetical protein